MKEQEPEKEKTTFFVMPASESYLIWNRYRRPLPGIDMLPIYPQRVRFKLPPEPKIR